MQRVKIKVKANEVVRFPGACVHCAYPAAETMPIRKRIDRVTRIIEVPVCENCSETLRKQSAAEERWQKLDYLLAGVAAVLTPWLVLWLLPFQSIPLIRWTLAIAVTVFVATAVHRLARRARANAALPAKKAIRESAAISYFSWRATTFQFTNEAFIKQFIELNQPSLM